MKGRAGVSSWRPAGRETTHHASCAESFLARVSPRWHGCGEGASSSVHRLDAAGLMVYDLHLLLERKQSRIIPYGGRGCDLEFRGSGKDFLPSLPLFVRNSQGPWGSHSSVLWAIYPPASGGCFCHNLPAVYG